MKVDEKTKDLIVNYPVKKALKIMEYWILQGLEVHLKFTCEKCKTRCSTSMPNSYFVEGYECGECGAKNVPREFGLMLIKKQEEKYLSLSNSPTPSHTLHVDFYAAAAIVARCTITLLVPTGIEHTSYPSPCFSHKLLTSPATAPKLCLGSPGNRWCSSW